MPKKKKIPKSLDHARPNHTHGNYTIRSLPGCLKTFKEWAISKGTKATLTNGKTWIFSLGNGFTVNYFNNSSGRLNLTYNQVACTNSRSSKSALAKHIQQYADWALEQNPDTKISDDVADLLDDSDEEEQK